MTVPRLRAVGDPPQTTIYQIGIPGPTGRPRRPSMVHNASLVPRCFSLARGFSPWPHGDTAGRAGRAGLTPTQMLPEEGCEHMCWWDESCMVHVAAAKGAWLLPRPALQAPPCRLLNNWQGARKQSCTPASLPVTAALLGLGLSSIRHHPLLITRPPKHAWQAIPEDFNNTLNCNAVACAAMLWRSCVHQRAKAATHRANKMSLLLLLHTHDKAAGVYSAGGKVIEKHVTRFLCQ